jgi:hypothetical protein
MPNELRRQYDRPHIFPDRWEVVFHWTGHEKFVAKTPEEALFMADLWLDGYTTRVAENIRDEELKREEMLTYVEGLKDEDRPDSS